MTDDSDKPKGPPERQWAPVEQIPLPAFRPVLGYPPRDWRQWSDGRGNQIDSPRRSGPTFGGKTVVPLTGPDGLPIRLGTFQIIRDARGVHVVVDWSRPVFEEAAPAEIEGDTERKTSSAPRTSAIMGKEVFRHRDLRRAQAAMIVLARDAEVVAKGLPLEPAQCLDDRKKEIRRGAVALCQYARGPSKGHFAVVDHSQTPRRIFDVPSKTLKEALRHFNKECARRAARQPAVAVRGAPISFDVPSGFGFGSGAGWSPRASWSERSYPEEGSLSWKTIVMMYARTGKWCKTARLIWADQRPPEIEKEAVAAREEYLLAAGERERERAQSLRDDPSALRAMKKLPKSEKALLNEVLEHFGASLLEVKL